MQTVFVNPERCIGCLQCELACAVEHSASQDAATAFLESPVPRKRVHVEAGPMPTLAFPNRCRHCDPAPCLQVCPSGAITREDELGVVLVEPRRCIGCAMCAVVCPFDVITFHPLADGPGPGVPVAVKCDGCVERVRRGDEPACAEVCKVDALGVRGPQRTRVGRQPAGGRCRPGRRRRRGHAASRWRPLGRVASLGCSHAGGGARLDNMATTTTCRRRESTRRRRSGRTIMTRSNGNGSTAPPDHQRGRPGDDRRGPQAGHRHRLGPARGPAAPVRLLRARPQLPELRHGAVPDRSVRRGARRRACAAPTPT